MAVQSLTRRVMAPVSLLGPYSWDSDAVTERVRTDIDYRKQHRGPLPGQIDTAMQGPNASTGKPKEPAPATSTAIL
jgi:hypothetical protein